VNEIFFSGQTALITWSLGNCRDVETLRALLECGADPNLGHGIHKQSALFQLTSSAKPVDACCFDHLLAAGANVHTENVFGVTLLHAACIIGAHKRVRLIVNTGVDVDRIPGICKGTPLYACASNNVSSCIPVLLAAGASLHARRKNQPRAITQAVEAGFAECVALLLFAHCVQTAYACSRTLIAGARASVVVVVVGGSIKESPSTTRARLVLADFRLAARIAANVVHHSGAPRSRRPSWCCFEAIARLAITGGPGVCAQPTATATATATTISPFSALGHQHGRHVRSVMMRLAYDIDPPPPAPRRPLECNLRSTDLAVDDDDDDGTGAMYV